MQDHATALAHESMIDQNRNRVGRSPVQRVERAAIIERCDFMQRAIETRAILIAPNMPRRVQETHGVRSLVCHLMSL
jgi:hypothetical protein